MWQPCCLGPGCGQHDVKGRCKAGKFYRIKSQKIATQVKTYQFHMMTSFVYVLSAYPRFPLI